MLSRLFPRILGLYEDGDIDALKSFLAGANNLRKVKSRALGAWSIEEGKDNSLEVIGYVC